MIFILRCCVLFLKKRNFLQCQNRLIYHVVCVASQVLVFLAANEKFLLQEKTFAELGIRGKFLRSKNTLYSQLRQKTNKASKLLAVKSAKYTKKMYTKHYSKLLINEIITLFGRANGKCLQRLAIMQVKCFDCFVFLFMVDLQKCCIEQRVLYLQKIFTWTNLI